MSDTPLSKLLKQGSSLTSYNIGQVAKLEAQIATITAELERVKAERDAALKDQARWLHWRRCWRHLGKMEPATAAGIDLTRVYIDSPEKLDERTDVAIDAAKEG